MDCVPPLSKSGMCACYHHHVIKRLRDAHRRANKGLTCATSLIRGTAFPLVKPSATSLIRGTTFASDHGPRSCTPSCSLRSAMPPSLSIYRRGRDPSACGVRVCLGLGISGDGEDRFLGRLVAARAVDLAGFFDRERGKGSPYNCPSRYTAVCS